MSSSREWVLCESPGTRQHGIRQALRKTAQARLTLTPAAAAAAVRQSMMVWLESVTGNILHRALHPAHNISRFAHYSLQCASHPASHII